MIRMDKIRLLSIRSSNALSVRSRSTTSGINIEKLEKDSILPDKQLIEDTEAKKREEEIENSRNKSRLSAAHRNILHELNPYSEPQIWCHGTVKYVRRIYGRYGAASGVNPSICWPLKEELEDRKEYEQVAHPQTIPEMIKEASQQRKEREERVMLRQKDVVEKLKKLDQWKQDLFNRIAKKEHEIKEAKERREKLVEEVRRHFGYTVDPRDEKFQLMLEKKEKEQKKLIKEARRKAKEEKLLEENKKKKNVPKKSKNVEKSEVEAENE